MLWVVNVTVSSKSRLLAADTLGCWDCCENEGPFRLMGRRRGHGAEGGGEEEEGNFWSFAQGEGWYAAASVMPGLLLLSLLGLLVQKYKF